jgi:hypothetical protein
MIPGLSLSVIEKLKIVIVYFESFPLQASKLAIMTALNVFVNMIKNLQTQSS